MNLLELDLRVNSEQLQKDIINTFQKSSTLKAIEVLRELVIDQIENCLDNYVNEDKIIRFKLAFKRGPYGDRGYPDSLRDLVQEQIVDLGFVSITIITELKYKISVKSDSILIWIYPIKTSTKQLKTVNRHVISIYGLGIAADAIKPASDKLNTKCRCQDELLLPYISGVWDWALRFICKVCGKSYYCECFRIALEKHYQEALKEQSHYGESGWPHLFLAAYNQTKFRAGICHLCREIHSDLFYCHPMYGNKVMVHYGPYIVRTAIEKDVSQKEAEEEIREMLGISPYGDKWISEIELLKLIRELYPEERVSHQASPSWLGLQRLDIYIPDLSLAIEYQGRQHYEPVDFFGGMDGFLRTQERDRKKARLCAENGVTLIYFRYDETIDRHLVKSRINAALPLK